MPVCSWRNTRSTQACVTDQSPRTLHNMLQTRAGVIVYVTKYSRSRFLDSVFWCVLWLNDTPYSKSVCRDKQELAV